MAQAILTRILEEIKTLHPDELQEVQRTVRGLLDTTSREAEREAALRVLEASGLVKEIKRPQMVTKSEKPLILIQGKPLSETIVEERR